MNKKRQKRIRIVSLAPSATSILCAIGARSALVGVTRWCADVAPVKGLPELGDCWKLNIDELLRLKPMLVIGSVPYKPETVADILTNRLTFLAMNPGSLADVESDIFLLGQITGRNGAARSVVARMRREFAAIAKKAQRAKRRPRVYCEAWPNPRISSPPWVAELIRMAGGEMVLPPGQRVTEEQVAEARPEVIILAWAAAGNKSKPEKSYSVDAWKDIPAIRNKRVYVVRDELLNTPGPPLVDGARELFRILHGQEARRGSE